MSDALRNAGGDAHCGGQCVSGGREQAAHGSQVRHRDQETSAVAAARFLRRNGNRVLAKWRVRAGAGRHSAGCGCAETRSDRLGRTTPRGTVNGFLGAARRGEDDLARQYLNTRQTGEAGAALAHQLFIVIDRRMRGRPELSDAPEGSRANPDSPPGLEIIGKVESASGAIDIVLEQQQRADGGLIWLFSRATLVAVPGIYEEIILARRASGLPAQLTSIRIGGIRLIEWAIMLFTLAALYPIARLLNRGLTALVRRIRRDAFERSTFAKRGVMPLPAQLLFLRSPVACCSTHCPSRCCRVSSGRVPRPRSPLSASRGWRCSSTPRVNDRSCGGSPSARRPRHRWPVSSGDSWICSWSSWR